MDDQELTRTSPTPDGAGESLLGEPAGQVGSYTLLRVLGEGGMGVVYLARQREPVDRHVALKLIRPGMATRDVLARFESERQALAVMNHPGIARVFDGGATSDGRPYFVMEYVDGEPITRFCDRHRLPLAARIELLVSVCRAVQHAHQKGVIHRDLKPSNIVVSMQDGTAISKVIDFGIAKAIGDPLTDNTFATQAGQWIGTPAYMSPEQLGMTGLDVDTRADVYSLGVVLYEVLAGVRPFDDRQMPHGHAAVVSLRGDDPPSPGARLHTLTPDEQHAIADARHTAVTTLHHELSTDLGWIANKAIERDRSRRYETVNSLAADLERYLKDEPVIARPASRSYRARKFVARHRAGVAAAGAILALVVAATVIIAVQARRVAVERDRARIEAARATSINQFLRDMLASADPWRQGTRQMTVVDALAAAERRVTSALADQPEVAVGVQRTIGDAYGGLGEFARAERLLTDAIEGLRPHESRRAELVETQIVLGGILRQAGRLDDAARMQGEALEAARPLSGDRRGLLATALQSYAETKREQGKAQEAEALASEALRLELDVNGRMSATTARAYETLGNVVSASDAERAETLVRSALEIRRQVRGPRHPEVGLTASNLGVVLLQRGEHQQAADAFREAVDILSPTLGDTHPSVAIANENMGYALMRLQRVDEAIARLEEVLRVRRAMLGDDSLGVARTLQNIAAVYLRANKLDAAERSFVEARAGLERTLGADHAEMPVVIRNQGFVRERRGDLPGAEALYRDALARNLRQLGEKNASTALSASLLGKVLAAQRRYDEAETELTRALEIRAATLGASAPLTAAAREDLAKLFDVWNKPERAAALRAASPAAGK